MPETAEKPSIEQRLAAHFAQRDQPEQPEAKPEETKPQEARPEEARLQKAQPAEPEEQVETGEAQAAEPDAPEPDDSEAVAVETLSDLAEVLGVDVSELYNVRVPVTTAEGERAEVSLSEWKDGYQANTRLQKASQDLEQKRAQFEQQQQQATKQLQERLQQTGALLNAAERQLVAEYEGIDWNRLRQDDPADWAAKRQDFQERQNAINQAKQQAVSEAKRLYSEQEQKTVQQREELLRKESELLKSAIPDWKDEGKARAEQAQLVDYLVSQGFPENDVRSITNHRLVLLARKAMLFDQRQKDAGVAKKKLVKVASKVLKPGGAQTKAQQQSDREGALRQRLKKTGNLDDAFALLSARRKG